MCFFLPSLYSVLFERKTLLQAVFDVNSCSLIFTSLILKTLVSIFEHCNCVNVCVTDAFAWIVLYGGDRLCVCDCE